ncbi:MAG: MATE family efflux transporter [Firmicutes bacterium]|nr:MATE family efflux transporter [Bacillota bacterium]
MNEQVDRIYVLESMPVYKAIWNLALPTMMAMLVQVIYNMTDTFFIGKLNQPNMVAAISISMPVFMMIQAFGNIYAVGGASLISRLLGQGDRGGASRTGAISFWSALVVCSAVSLAGLIFIKPVLMSCGASADTYGFGKSYLSIMLLGSPVIGLKMALAGLLRSEGATREAMIGMVSGSILNIILDPVFIFLFKMDVAGAAVATVIGNVVGFLYCLSFYLGKKGVVSISWEHYRFDREIYAEIFKIGIPASIGMILTSTGFAIANVFAAGFGDVVVAANGVTMRITNITVMLSMGLAFGCQPLMGFSYGARDYDRLAETIKKAIFIGTIICTSLAILFYSFSDFWIRVFINDPTVIALGAKIIRSFSLGMPVLGMQMLLMSTFQSLGKMYQSLAISLGRQGLFFIPALSIFSSLWGFNGFIRAMPVADVATALLSLILYLAFKQRFQLIPKGCPERLISQSEPGRPQKQEDICYSGGRN